MKIALIGCVKTKDNKPCKARDLYISPLFSKSLAYVENVIKPDKIYILSAKYGFIPEDKIIEPYDKTLLKMSLQERKDWAKQIIEDIKKEYDTQNDEFYILAGSKYCEFIKPELKHIIDPMEGLSQGRRLQFLNDNTPNIDINKKPIPKITKSKKITVKKLF